MEITREVHLKLTNKELNILREANEILNSICYNCHCDAESCPLYGLCSASDTPSTIGVVLGDIIDEAMTE